MRNPTSPRGTLRAALLCGLAMLASCAPKPAPAPPPVAPPRIIIPPRPAPPLGAAPNLVLPPLGPGGTRLTINSGLSPDQTVWNLRSAYNVAALNCQRTEHQAINTNYSQFLKTNKKVLATTYKNLDKQFKKDFGKDYIVRREVYQTQVYNYFAFPPVLPIFCGTMLQVGQEVSTIAPKDLALLAPAQLAKLEKIYQDFFVSYAQYQRDLAAWNERYGAIAQAGATPASIVAPPPAP